jgi:hypothetical protein
MIYKVRIYKLRISELLQFLNDVIKLVNQHSTEPMQLAAVITALVTDTNNFDKYFKLEMGSAITQELIDLDSRRDECIIGIRLILEGYSRHFDEATKAAAKNLLANMDKYGSQIYNLNYQAETSTISSLINDWNSMGTLTGAVSKLNLAAWVNELNTVNTLFNDSYLKRVDEKGSAPQIKSIDARKKAIVTYKTLIQHIEAKAILAQGETFTTLINNLNVLATKYNTIADSHTEKAKDK